MAEQTYMIFHPTRLAFLKWYALSVLIIAASIAFFILSADIEFLPADYRLYATVILGIAGFSVIVMVEIKRHDDDYAITDERIVERTGLVSIKQDSIYWEKVSNFSIKQNLFDRLFGIGTVEIWSISGDDEPQIVIKRASNFKKIVSILNRFAKRK